MTSGDAARLGLLCFLTRLVHWRGSPMRLLVHYRPVFDRPHHVSAHSLSFSYLDRAQWCAELVDR
jgi:hypothetical protein